MSRRAELHDAFHAGHSVGLLEGMEACARMIEHLGGEVRRVIAEAHAAAFVGEFVHELRRASEGCYHLTLNGERRWYAPGDCPEGLRHTGGDE